MPIHLILGGARSGKSAYAERLAKESGLPVTYIATAQVYDDEFRARIAHHQVRRPADWKLVESPFQLAETLKQEAQHGHCIIVDCLTLWLAQCICPDCAPADFANNEGVNWEKERTAFLEMLANAIAQLPTQVLLVSNEVGMGIVPLGAINRQFQDEQGRLNQAVAAIADQVTFVAAGLPLVLKPQ